MSLFIAPAKRYGIMPCHVKVGVGPVHGEMELFFLTISVWLKETFLLYQRSERDENDCIASLWQDGFAS